MKGPRRKAVLLLAASALVFGSTVLVFVSRRLPPEPIYNGRSLSAWLVDLNYSGLPADLLARHAVGQMGTNVLPHLKPILNAHDSRLKLKLIQLARKLPIWKVQHTPAEVLQQRASCACRALGPAAIEYLPELTVMLDSPDLNTAWGGLVAILNLKSRDQSIPELTRALTNHSSQVRGLAASALGGLHERASNCVPALMARMNDQSPEVRSSVQGALFRIQRDHAALAAMMVAKLSDPDRQIRISALRVLERLKAEACDFEEEIRKLLAHDDQAVRVEAARVLTRLSARCG